jgi:predicted nucleotide-binding protein
MDFKVYLNSEDQRVKSYVDKTINIINAHQSEFRVIDMQGTIVNQDVCKRILDASSGDVISFPLFESTINECLSSTEYHIIVTDKLFDDNYFTHAKINVKMISVSDWDRNYAPPHMDKYVLRQILKFYIRHCIDYVLPTHKDSKGCLFDFCTHKTDIKISMRTGYLCPECRQKMREYGFSEQQFQSLQNLLNLMAGKATFDKVFIVHGHEGKDEVARYISEQLHIEPIILSEQPNRGRTIIEKFEAYSSVDFAVVLYTPDDLGCVKTATDKLIPRARQNVVFEHGYFTAKLGRENVLVLLKSSTDKTRLEREGDTDGIVYVPFDEYGGWKEELRRALKLSGYQV